MRGREVNTFLEVSSPSPLFVNSISHTSVTIKFVLKPVQPNPKRKYKLNLKMDYLFTLKKEVYDWKFISKINLINTLQQSYGGL